MSKKYLWKSMRMGLKSEYGKINWKMGEWRKVTGELEMCENGFHASERIIDSMHHIAMECLAKVEVRGDHLEQSNKQCWEEMRIVKAWNWEKKDSVSLAIYATSLVLKNFEKVYPNDKRPRQAIQSARKWLKYPTEENRLAAGSAALSATWSVWSAAESAERSAAWSAESAAESAARSAAWSAAGSAAGSDKVLNKIEAWIKRRIKTLEEEKT